MSEAQIAGWAHSPLGKSPMEDIEQSIASVAGAAIEHSDLGSADIDGFFAGVMSKGFSRQGFQGALVAMGNAAHACVPAMRFENACATGSTARRAWAGALSDASLSLSHPSFAEAHDCFTIAEMIEYEAKGHAAFGEGYEVVRDGQTLKDGRFPVNPTDDFKSKGHPISVIGVSTHVMAATQLVGETGEMQLVSPPLAGVFNMGDASATNHVSIQERAR